ncbi:hypothetical protein R1flu_004886 [Riccia fluitans]|uniref:Thioesterase domain-containing protein n=1 Tax=Riccia fluitans TaxID=41844 RepID=A0ABD1YRK1_9MARC
MLRMLWPPRYLTVALLRSVERLIRPAAPESPPSLAKIVEISRKFYSSSKFEVPLGRKQASEGFQFRSFAMTALNDGSSSGVRTRDPLMDEVKDDRHRDYRGLKILEFIGFEVTQLSATKSTGRFVVSKNSSQPFNVLHGGTTAYIAESMASVSASIAAKHQRVAGIDLNCSHLRSVPIGSEVEVTAIPLRVGKRVQVWEVKFETTKPEKPDNTQTAESSKASDTSSQLVLAAISRVTLLGGRIRQTLDR